MDDNTRKREATRLRVERFRAIRRKIDVINEATEVADVGPSTSAEYQESVSRDVNHSFVESPDLELILQQQLTADFENEEREGRETIIESDQSDKSENIGLGLIDTEREGDETVMESDQSDKSENIGLGLIHRERESDESSVTECDSETESSGSEEEMEELPETHGHHAEGETTQLRQWAMKSNIPQTHLDELLGILRNRLLPDLPASSKTFLKTSSAEYDLQTFKKADGTEIGQFVYFGIAKHLQRCVNPNLHEDNCLNLQINMDGLPLLKSSYTQFWPILCKVHYQPDVYEPFPVAVYAGIKENPNNLEQYLHDFIEEINELLLNGIIIEGKTLNVHIQCFICDTPARAFVKGVKNHGGYYACERCTVRGEHYKKRTVYASTTCEERSDISFRNQDNPEHHNAVTPLIAITFGLNLVLQFLLDFMHLCCLGVMKKMLVEFWLNSHKDSTTTSSATTRPTTRPKFSQNSKLFLSQLLLSLQSQIPSDFQRTTRSITDIAKWKATEFRFFLLYCGPIVLKRVLPEKLFRHFLLFHVACRILCSKDLAQKFNNQAKIYLINFVKLTRIYYGTESQVMNIHNLIHLADDAKNMKCSLSEMTAFPFENILGKMKKLLRSGNRPLAQLCRRLHETLFANTKKAVLPPEIVILRKHRESRAGIIRVKKLKYKEALLSTHPSDNTVFLQNGKILRVDDIYMQSDENLNTLQITGVILRIKKPIFTYPCDSAALKMWEVTDGQRTRVKYPLESIATKMVTFSIFGDDLLTDQKLYTMPLLHMQ